ncbi:SGNH hydrolase, partial [Sarocladium strictum]
MALPDLRVMPLGDSLTRGDKSSDSMGYRRQLRYKLLSESTNVDLVGSQRSPLDTDEDNDWEGKDGADLAEINAAWPESIATQPNVVLVHAGTTNIANEEDLDGAPDLMAEIIDGLLGGAPETVVLVSPVMWVNKESFWAPRDAFNEQLSAIVQGKQDEGKHVLEVPIVIGPDDLDDAFNPNDRGYENIAQFWVDAIRDADERGWLKDPP